MSKVDLDAIQSIVHGYPDHPFAAYLFIRFSGPDRARRWVRDVSAEVDVGDWRGRAEAAALNVAVTWSGLMALGAPDETLATFPIEFRVGMAARAARYLGDLGHDAPAHWERPGPGVDDVHAVAIVHASTEADREQRCAAVHSSLVGAGAVVARQDGARLKVRGQSTEHFGFVDGVAQPVVEGLNEKPGTKAAVGQGAPDGRGPDGWRALRTGEVILGYPDEEGCLPLAPAPSELGRNGTFLVYRKLRQHVGAFRSLVSVDEARYPGGPDELAAKIVGRRRDGTPLALVEPGTAMAAGHGGGTSRLRDPFTYADDRDGVRCPIGSHIRRANPRDGFEARNKIVSRHRMLRRGIPYGPILAPGRTDDDGEERGLLFVCVCASIGRQFEFVQGRWLADGNGLGLGGDQDVLLSDGGANVGLTVPGHSPWFVRRPPRLITVRGGEYFFLPGRNGLRWLGRDQHVAAGAAPVVAGRPTAGAASADAPGPADERSAR